MTEKRPLGRPTRRPSMGKKTLLLDVKVLARLEAASRRTGVPQSHIVERALEAYLTTAEEYTRE